MTGVGVLANLAVELQGQVEVVRVLDLVRGREPRAQHGIAVDGLAHAAILAAANRHIQTHGVTGDACKRPLAGNAARFAADDHRKLEFVIRAPIRKTSHDPFARSHQRRHRLQEAQGLADGFDGGLVEYDPFVFFRFVDVGLVVDGSAEQLGGIGYRTVKGDLLEVMSWCIRPNFLHAFPYAVEVSYQEIPTRRQGPANVREDIERRGHVQHGVALNITQPGLVESTEFHGSITLANQGRTKLLHNRASLGP